MVNPISIELSDDNGVEIRICAKVRITFIELSFLVNILNQAEIGGPEMEFWSVFSNTCITQQLEVCP